jgi:P27 family predicted phage terminase small subunit
MKGRKQRDPIPGPGRPGRRPSKAELANRHENIVSDELAPLEKPADLSKEAAVIWDVTVPNLMKTKVICSLDQDLLRDYCETVANRDKYEKYVAKNGPFVEISGGRKQLRPEAKLATMYRKDALKLGEHLGLSPKSRRNMNIKLPQPVSAEEAEKRRKKEAVFKRRS